MNPTLRLLFLGALPAEMAASSWGPFESHHCGSADEVASRLMGGEYDALVLQLPDPFAASGLPAWPTLSQACASTAVVVVTDRPSAALAEALLERGVQDVIDTPRDTPRDTSSNTPRDTSSNTPRDTSSNTEAAAPDGLARAVHLAVLRKRMELSARKAYATDLATGLPSQSQLLEHVNHLLALREREPAPMALLVIRVEGLATAEASLGAAAAGALRRKLAVRLRASLRASDVVASVGADAFAALLAWIDAPIAADRVAAKLTRALQRPLRITGQDQAVAVSVGVAHYPEQGKDALSLLRHAFGEAAVHPAQGRAGFANRAERGAGAAANDE